MVRLVRLVRSIFGTALRPDHRNIKLVRVVRKARRPDRLRARSRRQVTGTLMPNVPA